MLSVYKYNVKISSPTAESRSLILQQYAAFLLQPGTHIIEVFFILLQLHLKSSSLSEVLKIALMAIGLLIIIILRTCKAISITLYQAKGPPWPYRISIKIHYIILNVDQMNTDQIDLLPNIIGDVRKP